MRARSTSTQFPPTPRRTSISRPGTLFTSRSASSRESISSWSSTSAGSSRSIRASCGRSPRSDSRLGSGAGPGSGHDGRVNSPNFGQSRPAPTRRRSTLRAAPLACARTAFGQGTCLRWKGKNLIPFPIPPSLSRSEAKLNTRRQFLKKGLYLAPAILTLSIRPSFASPSYKPPDDGNGGGNPQPSTIPMRRWRVAPWRV